MVVGGYHYPIVMGFYNIVEHRKQPSLIYLIFELLSLILLVLSLDHPGEDRGQERVDIDFNEDLVIIDPVVGSPSVIAVHYGVKYKQR